MRNRLNVISWDQKLTVIFLLFIGSIIVNYPVRAQVSSFVKYKQQTYMIPMRDGIRLFTSIQYPVDLNTKVPFLLVRTPYGVDTQVRDSAKTITGTWAELASSGYIIVKQDIRGKFNSEGKMQIHQPLIHQYNKKAIDESTDTYDTVDWLIKHIANNNGKVGLIGQSYDGWLVLTGAAYPHPGVKAACEQACMADLFLGDDFHHNGAFRLSYGFEYGYEVEHNPQMDSQFPFPDSDLYDWYLKLGPLSNVNKNYFHGKIPTWNSFVNHPDYDNYWRKNSPLSYMPAIKIPILHVGGYYDQEDLYGPQLMYNWMEKHDKQGFNHLILGPWNHGLWNTHKSDSLGAIEFGFQTAKFFKDLQRKWFDFYLKNIGDGKFCKAYIFQTGSNQWKSYNSWTPKNMVIKRLYAGNNKHCSFIKSNIRSVISYISDPENPVPYRSRPIEPTYGKYSRWPAWQVEDQRFLSNRKDVISFEGDILPNDLIVTGQINAHLLAASTGTDADWIVKLIDVYPIDKLKGKLSGYQLPVAMEVFRSRFRKNFSKPRPLIPNKPEVYTINMHQINHCFKKGHHLMIQIQSSWFPVIDRNPQRYIANIFKASADYYQKAKQSVCVGGKDGTYIEMPVSN